MSQTDFTLQKEMLESHEKALDYFNKLFAIVPPFAYFEPFTVYKLSKRTDIDASDLNNKSGLVIDLFVKLKYATFDGVWLQLTDLGREVKKAGGYIAYEKRLKEIADRNDRKENVDLDLKELANRFKFVTFGLPFITLGIAFISLAISLKKEFFATPQMDKSHFLQLNLNVTSDSLKKSAHVDTLLKK